MIDRYNLDWRAVVMFILCVLLAFALTVLCAGGVQAQTCTVDGQVPIWTSATKWTCGTPTATPGPLPAGSSLNMIIANDTVTGTTVNRLAKLTGAPSKAVITGADTEGAVGICVSGCGATGNATIAIIGQVTCDFSGATTAGNYVIIGATGQCSDGGSAFPTAGATYGRVLSTNVGAGAYVMELMTPDVAFQNAGNGKSKPGTPDTSVQFASSNQFAGNAAFTYNNSTNTVTLTQGTKTVSSPFLDHTATWNAAGTTFINFQSNITNSGSALGSLLFDWQLNGTTQFRLRKSGTNASQIEFSQPSLAPNGSAALPSYSFTNCISCGLRTDGTHTYASANGGQAAMFYRLSASDAGIILSQNNGGKLGWGNSSSIAFGGFATNGIGQVKIIADNAENPGTLYSPSNVTSGSGAFTPNLQTGQVFRRTLTGSQTFNAPSNQASGIVITLTIIQDATGSRTVTWNAAYKFVGGVAPTLTTAANAVDIIVFISDGTNVLEISRALDVK